MSATMTAARVEQLAQLRDILRATGGCAVAYSGGVDSSLVLAVAHEVLGDRVLAVTATSSTYAQAECRAALEWVESQGIPHVAIESEELDVPGFRDNPPDRCYHCKHELFSKVREQADAHGLAAVADGSSAEDTGDYRPGMRAARELDVISPLLEAGLKKDDIRALARDVYNLPVADKPAMACLASRFPYGSQITRDKLGQVEALESFLRESGFAVYRARHHGSIVRLELGSDERRRIQQPEVAQAVVACAKAQGFAYVTLDLEGYRTGSMNETLAQAQPSPPSTVPAEET